MEFLDLLTLTLTFKFLFKAYCHVIEQMLYCAAYSLRKKLIINEIKKFVNTYCQFFPIYDQNIKVSAILNLKVSEG